MKTSFRDALSGLLGVRLFAQIAPLGGRCSRRFHLSAGAFAANFLLMFAFAMPGGLAQNVPDVAGLWTCSGTISATISAQGQSKQEQLTAAPDQSVYIYQNGSSFSFTYSGSFPDGYPIDETYKGTISDGLVTLKGPMQGELEAFGSTVAHFTGSAVLKGPLVAGTMYLTNGSFSASTSYSGIPISISGTPDFMLLAEFPMLTITSPTAGLQVIGSAFTVTGTAGDDPGIECVCYNLNNTGWNLASTSDGWTNWSADVTLVSGPNVLQAYALDYDGNISPTITVNFTCEVPGLVPLRVGLSQADVKSTDSIDDPIVPVTDANALSTSAPLGMGVVADDVTPVLFQFSGPATNYTVQITHDAVAYNTGPLGNHLFVLRGGKWTVTQSLVPSSFSSHGIAYMYLGGLTWTNFSGAPPNGVTVTVNIYPVGSSTAVASTNFLVVPVPIVLVHGIADTGATWSPLFRNALTQNVPPQFVQAITYGQGGTGLFDKQLWPSCTFPLDLLATEVDADLHDVENQLSINWDFTRYDAVGHSQGGVLLRMLCQTAGAYGRFTSDRMPVVSPQNLYRGRFRRIVTIGSPHNGSLILHYINQLNMSINTLDRLFAGIVDFCAPASLKFDPTGRQMQLINATEFAVDPRIPFHCVQATINGGKPPVIDWFENPPEYNFLGLANTLLLGSSSGETRGQVLIPFGSDGVVDFASQGGGAGTPVDSYLNDTSHCGPELLFAVPFNNTETASAAVGTDVANLLSGPASNFGPFVLPPPISLNALNAYNQIVPSIQTIFGAIIQGITANTPSTNLNYNLTIPSNLPLEGTVNWEALDYGTNGIGTNGVSVQVNTNDSTQMTLSVNSNVVGQVVVSAEYLTINGDLVFATPVVALTIPTSSGASLTNIQLEPSAISLAAGDTMPTQIVGNNSDGSESYLYTSPGQATYVSSNPLAASVDTNGTITMISAGVATITASYQGFTAQTLVSTIAPFITSQPQSISVGAGAKAILSVTAAGVNPLAYQWLLNGKSIVAATNSLLSISSAQATNTGSYLVVVSNLFGTVTSSVATLSVATRLPSPPTITSPANNYQTGGITLNVLGKEPANGQAGAIMFQLNDGTAQNAQISGQGLNWSATLMLQPGTNHFSVWATNVVGASSAVTAYYVLNPFIPLAGEYEGIFTPIDTRSQGITNTGFLVLTLQSVRTFSGKMQLDGATISYTGQLGNDGAAQLLAGNSSTGMFELALQLDLSGSGLLSGSVSNVASTWTAPLTAKTAGYSAKSPAANFSGNYVLAMNGSSNPTNAPAGYSFAFVTVSPAGAVTGTGTLADGSTFAPSGSLSKDGSWPLFYSLYSGKGSVLGWVNFAGHSSEGQAVTGQPFWFKRAGTGSQLYNGGFSFLQNQLSLIGDPYAAPPKGVATLPAGNYNIQIFGGNLGTTTISNNATINANNVVILSPNSNHLSITLNAAKGAFSGTFINPVTLKQTVLSGVLLPANVSGKAASPYESPAGRDTNSAMKQDRVSQRGRAPRIDAARRAQLLAAFDRSGLSAAAFARQQGVHYTTFCGWRQRRDRGSSSPGFVQVEIPESTRPVELVIEWGGTTRLRLTSAAQIPLAARLLQSLQEGRPC